MRMKKLIIGTLVLLGLCLSATAQDETIKIVKSGFKTGTTTEIVNLLSNKVEVAFDGEKKIYSKNETEKVLNEFFTTNKPKDFEILHQGASKIGLKFFIGEYKASTGTFRILIYLRSKENKSLIETIDISKE